MSPSANPLSTSPATAPAVTPAFAPLVWADPARAAHFGAWLQAVAPAHGLQPASVRLASADASFRRYLRVDDASGRSFIVMDAPPDKENCQPFVQVAQRMAAAGLAVPAVLAWDQENGFLLLSDLGEQTMMQHIQASHPHLGDAFAQQDPPSAATQELFGLALHDLVRWQQASRPGVLPAYDAALLRRELELFPDWYLARHKGVEVDAAVRATLDPLFELIVARNLGSPQVFVHRDFMPRNLMLPLAGQGLGILDFQDAVHGPVTYDIASLMRDAFWSWDEAFVLDQTVRYWQLARKANLLDYEDWHQDFGAFYRAVEWMGLQRHLKVAGIFARLTLRDGKPHYLADAPRFIRYLRATAARYRELTPLLRLLDRVEGTEAVSGWAFGRV